MHTNILALALAGMGFSAGAASAQEFYWGGGLAYTSGTSETAFEDTDLQAGMVSLILGQRFAAGSGFWGWEASADLSFGAETTETVDGFVCDVDGAYAAYLCSHDATIRLVGIYGTPIGNGTEVFGSLGVGILSGKFADNFTSVESATNYGLTVGVGLGHDLGNGSMLRGEVIYDSFGSNTQTENPYSSSHSGVTARIALIRKF